MKDEDKTKGQLIAELVESRRRIVALEELESQRKRLEEGRALKIGEILMEMSCLTRLQLVRYLKKQKEEMDSYRYEHRQKRLGEILLEASIVTEEELHSALSEQQRRKRGAAIR